MLVGHFTDREGEIPVSVMRIRLELMNCRNKKIFFLKERKFEWIGVKMRL